MRAWTRHDQAFGPEAVWRWGGGEKVEVKPVEKVVQMECALSFKGFKQ